MVYLLLLFWVPESVLGKHFMRLCCTLCPETMKEASSSKNAAWSLGRGAHGLCVIKINSIQTLDQLLHLYGLGWILPKIVLFSWKGHWFPVWRLSLRLKYFGNFILKFEMQVFLKQQCNNYECGNGLPTNLTFLVSSIFCTLLLCLIWNL